MKCPNCGFDGPPEMKHCGLCGTRLPFVCPSCGFVNPAEYRFCGMCGTALPLVCPNCGFANGTTHRYCANCGTRLSMLADSGLPPGSQQQVLGFEQQWSAAPAAVKAGSEDGLAPAIARLEGQRRQATVVIADVKRSTDLMEQIGTEAWVEMMNQVFHVLEREIYRYGGVIDQFRGDGLVAFFGTAIAHEDDPERAVLAALAMQDAIKAFATDLADREGVELALRVAMNTGEVIVASIGDSSRYSEDTAMGGAVAVADRMEKAAEPGTVLVSENTYRLIQSRFEWQGLGEMAVRGLSRPMAVYRPLAPRDDAERSLRLAAYGLPSLLIGRDEQLSSLRHSLKSLRSGRGGIVLLTGDEGMGKSHLSAQARQQDQREIALLAKTKGSDDPADFFPTLVWLEGRCRSYEQSRPYSIWTDLLQDWLGVREGGAKEETRARLRRQAEDLWGESAGEYYPYLAASLSLFLEEELAERIRLLGPEGLHQQILLSYRSWAESMTARGPLVLALEDLHWADASSLEMLEYCLGLCQRESLLWLLICRRDRFSEAWGLCRRIEEGYSECLTSLRLPPLTAAQSGQMIDELIGMQTLPEETRSLIVRRAEGNPYYIEELVQSLIRGGVLARDADSDSWYATRSVDSLDLPDTLRGLLLARIDDLLPDERHLLQMAAVIGETFWANVLRCLVSEQGAFEERLVGLQRTQLIREKGLVPDLGVEYAFQSELIRDAAYESLLSAQRLACHRRVAEYLEEFFGLDTLPRYYGLLAYHYRSAGDPNKELFYSLQAAEQAKAMYSNAEALKHYSRALELLDKLQTQISREAREGVTDGHRLYVIGTQRFEVLNGRREVLFLTGDYEAARADAQALLPIARQLDDDPAWLIDALLQQLGVAGTADRSALEEGVPKAEQALELSRKIGDRYREMQSLLAIAGQRVALDDPKAQKYAQAALQLAQQMEDCKSEVNILVRIGNILAWDEPDRSLEYLEKALPISLSLDDRLTQMRVLGLIGMQLERKGDYVKLLTECHERQLQISRELGYRSAEASSLMYCGQDRALYLGDQEGGLELLEQARRAQEGRPDELFVLLRIAQTLAVQSQHDAALELLAGAHRQCGQNAQDLGRVVLAIVSAIVYNAIGSATYLEKTLAVLDEARKLLADRQTLPRQYAMAAACEASAAHLGLAAQVDTPGDRQLHVGWSLEFSKTALDLYESLRGVQVIECTSEEILYRHSSALAADERHSEAVRYLQAAYGEMDRKHQLIPVESPFRLSFIESNPLRRDIRSAYQKLSSSG